MHEPGEGFVQSCKPITENIVKIISTKSIKAVYDVLKGDDKEVFKHAYSASYLPAKEILQDIYDEALSGNEICMGVIMHRKRISKFAVGNDGADRRPPRGQPSLLGGH